MLNQFNYMLYSYVLAHPFHLNKECPNDLSQIILRKHKLADYNKLYGAQYRLQSLDIDTPQKGSKANEGPQTIQETKKKEEQAKLGMLIQKEQEKVNFKFSCLELAKKLINENLKFDYLPFSGSYILTQIHSMYFYASACYQDREYGNAQVWFEKILDEPAKILDEWYMATNKQYDLKLNHCSCTIPFSNIRKSTHYFLGRICLEVCLKPSHHRQQDTKVGQIDKLCKICLLEAHQHFIAAWETEYEPVQYLELIDPPQQITSLNQEKKNLKVVCFAPEQSIRNQTVEELKNSLERAKNPLKNPLEKEFSSMSSLLWELKREYHLMKDFIGLCRKNSALRSNTHLKDMLAILSLDAKRRLLYLVNSNSSSAMWELSQYYGNTLEENEKLLLWKNSKHPEAIYHTEKNNNKDMIGYKSLSKLGDAISGCLFGSLKIIIWDLNISLSDKALEKFFFENLYTVDRQLKDIKNLDETKKEVETLKELIEVIVDEHGVQIGKQILDYFRQFQI